MNRTFRRPSLTTVIAVLALFLALGSSAHAGGLLTGKQIKNESITGKDVKKLTGKDIDERTLDTVRRADTALDADRVGGIGDQFLLTTFGCQSGKVLGYARVKGQNMSMPNVYSSSATYVDAPFNCSGGQVVVRRVGVGHYRVRFVDNPAFLAFAQIRVEFDPEDDDVCASIYKIMSAGVDQGAFDVATNVCGTDNAEDADFSLLLP